MVHIQCETTLTIQRICRQYCFLYWIMSYLYYLEINMVSKMLMAYSFAHITLIVRYLDVLQQVLEILHLQSIEVGIRFVHLQRVHTFL